MVIGLISPKGETKEETINKIGRSPLIGEYYKVLKEKIYDKRSLWGGISSALPVIASLTPKEYEIEIIDENIEEIDFLKTYDLVAISFMTYQAVRAYEIGDIFREKNITVVMGGVHPTFMQEEAKKHCDSLISGECENVWGNLLNDFSKGKLKAFYSSDLEVDLTKVPIPRYDLLKKNKYDLVWVQTSRGCPHDCEFCVVHKMYGKKRRNKTIEQIVKEIKYIKNYIGNVHIGFSDENFFANKKFAKALLKELVPLNIRWNTFTDVSIAEDAELLDLARNSGCISLLIGLESINDKSLEKMNANKWKMKKLHKYKEYIEIIQAHGIGVVGSFIMGLDDDDYSSFEATRNFILENNFYFSYPTVLNPFPGTNLRNRLIKEDRILDTGWDNYIKSGINIVPKNMTIEQLALGMTELYKEIYKPETILNTMRHFRIIYEKLEEVEKQRKEKITV